MGSGKYLIVLVSLFFVTFSLNISSSVANLTNFNLVQTKGNAKIITGNESLIFSNEKIRIRDLEVNFTPANSNDGEILVQKVIPTSRKTKSGKMKSQIAELLSKFKSADIKEPISIEEIDHELEVSTTAWPISGSNPTYSETPDVEVEEKIIISNIEEIDHESEVSTTTLPISGSHPTFSEMSDLEVEENNIIFNIEKTEHELEISSKALSISGSNLTSSETPDVEEETKTIISNIESVMQNNVQKKIRKPVKLNLKQGLMMNQILGVYGLNDAKNSLCNHHVSEFKLGLRALEPWAIKMFDASSKLMSGVTGGNLAELGSFNQCLDIYEETIYGPIKGQHCTLNIHPTDELVKIILSYRKKVSPKHYMNLKNNVLDSVKLTWSVCVPHSCSHEDVLRHFNKSITDVTEGLNLTLSLAKEHCVTVDDLPDMTTGDYIYIFVVGLLIMVAVMSTVIDIFIEDCTSEIVNLFSLKRNAEILFSTTKGSDEITCLYGLRCFSMYFIVYGHRYINNMATPVVNYMDLVDVSKA